MVNIQLRKCTIEDSDRLRAFAESMYYETFKGMCSEEDMQAYLETAFDQRRILGELNDPASEFYLITVRGDKRVDLKEFRKAYHTRPLTFASAEDLLAILKLTPGSVTPLGLLNDDDRRVEFYLDDCFLNAPGRIGCHPNDNTATVWIKTGDLIRMIEEHGNAVHLAEL